MPQMPSIHGTEACVVKKINCEKLDFHLHFYNRAMTRTVNQVGPVCFFQFLLSAL